MKTLTRQEDVPSNCEGDLAVREELTSVRLADSDVLVYYIIDG